jgi:transcriptional regulator with XRE-family HTH domain
MFSLMEKTPTEVIAGNVRAELARQRIGQRQVAEHLQLNQQQVSRRLLGQVAFTAPELRAVAELLDLSVGSLYGETDTAAAR